MMLAPLGVELSCFSTGPEGLAALRAEPPDLLLLDVMLSSPSEGFHLAYDLQADETLRQIPIVMISALGEKTGLDFAREVGTDFVAAEAFLDKPIKAEKLRETVQRVLAAHPVR